MAAEGHPDPLGLALQTLLKVLYSLLAFGGGGVAGGGKPGKTKKGTTKGKTALLTVTPSCPIDISDSKCSLLKVTISSNQMGPRPLPARRHCILTGGWGCQGVLIP